MNNLKKIWGYGTKTPFQRVGVLILTLGLVSALSWFMESDMYYMDVIDPYYFPDYRDSYFYHLYLYLVPIGLLMSWGYDLLQKIKSWVATGATPLKTKSTLAPTHSTSKQELKNLHFKDNLSAFQYAVSITSASFLPGQMSLGLIQESGQTKDGNTYFLVQLANSKNTTLVYGYNDKYTNSITRGNLVYWGFLEEVTDIHEIDAFGAILAILHPEYNPNTLRWEIKQNLTK